MPHASCAIALKRFVYPHAEGVTVLALRDVGGKGDVVFPVQFEANASANGRENVVVAELADRPFTTVSR